MPVETAKERRVPAGSARLEPVMDPSMWDVTKLDRVSGGAAMESRTFRWSRGPPVALMVQLPPPPPRSRYSPTGARTPKALPNTPAAAGTGDEGAVMSPGTMEGGEKSLGVDMLLPLAKPIPAPFILLLLLLLILHLVNPLPRRTGMSACRRSRARPPTSSRQ